MNKRLYIMRAASGSSKSTIANLIAKGYGDSCIIFSTDNYFMVDGKYCFDESKLHEYHSRTLSDVGNAMLNSVECVILDNTNLNSKHVRPYVKLAKTYGYSVTVIEVDCGLEEAKNRNNTRTPDRKVPDEVLDRQYKSFISARLNVNELVR